MWDRRIFLVSLILQGVGLIVNQSVVVPENTFYITVRACKPDKEYWVKKYTVLYSSIIMYVYLL